MAATYFGYGSNLNGPDLDRWCAEAGLASGWITRTTSAWLPDYRLAFDHRSVRRGGGTLNVVRACGHAVPGVLFEVAEDGWEALDRKEGARGGRHYRRLETVVLLPDGSERAVTTYESARPEAAMEPAPGYVDVVRQGYVEHGLPVERLDAAARGAAAPIDHLFVYGSLRRAGWLSEHLQPDVVDARDASIRGDLYDLGEYPGYRDGPGRVHGELCRIRDVEAVLARLDDIEGFEGYGRSDNLFRRVLVVPEGEPEPAWAYMLTAATPGTRLMGGTWPAR